MVAVVAVHNQTLASEYGEHIPPDTGPNQVPALEQDEQDQAQPHGPPTDRSQAQVRVPSHREVQLHDSGVRAVVIEGATDPLMLNGHNNDPSRGEDIHGAKQSKIHGHRVCEEPLDADGDNNEQYSDRKKDSNLKKSLISAAMEL